MSDFIEQFITGNCSFLFRIRIPTYVIARLFLLYFLSAVVVVFCVKDKRLNIKYLSLSTLFFYISCIICHTIIFRESSESYSYKLIPFWSYIEIFRSGQLVYLYENILNVILFFPIGFFMRAFLGRDKFMTAMSIGLCLSVLIEIAQLLFRKGLFEFDDLFHNCAGCALGFGTYLVLRRIIRAQ